MKPNNKISALLLIIVMTFVGMSSSFYILKETEGDVGLWDTEWYNLFIPYEKEVSNYKKKTMDSMDLWLESAINAETNRALAKLRPLVLVGTFIFFLLGLFFSYKYYCKGANVGVLWLLLLIALYLIFENKL